MICSCSERGFYFCQLRFGKDPDWADPPGVFRLGSCASAAVSPIMGYGHAWDGPVGLPAGLEVVS